jgi:hypothetical protein
VTGQFKLRNANTLGAPDIILTLGNPGDQPIAGHWAATMSGDGVGVFRPSNGILYLKKELTTGFADNFAIMGNPSDIGVAGDWDGNGLDSPGVYRPSGSTFYLSNNSSPSGIVFGDLSLGLGNPCPNGANPYLSCDLHVRYYYYAPGSGQFMSGDPTEGQAGALSRLGWGQLSPNSLW